MWSISTNKYKKKKKSFIFHVAVIFATVSAGIFFQVIQRFTKKLPRFHGNLLALYLNFILWDKYVIYFHSWVIIKKKILHLNSSLLAENYIILYWFSICLCNCSGPWCLKFKHTSFCDRNFFLLQAICIKILLAVLLWVVLRFPLQT